LNHTNLKHMVDLPDIYSLVQIDRINMLDFLFKCDIDVKIKELKFVKDEIKNLHLKIYNLNNTLENIRSRRKTGQIMKIIHDTKRRIKRN